jgi:hypothetical protein
MSFPRTTAVSRHLTRKSKHQSKLAAISPRMTDSAIADLDVLTRRLAAAVRSANSAAPGAGR